MEYTNEDTKGEQVMSQQLVELMVYTRKKVNQQTKKPFTSYSTKYDFIEDGHAERVTHYVTLKFTGDAFDDSSVKKEEIKRGLLKVDATQVGMPDKWEVVEENGKKKYPECWIRGGIVSFKPIAKEHEFHFNTEDVIEEESELPEEIED